MWTFQILKYWGSTLYILLSIEQTKKSEHLKRKLKEEVKIKTTREEKEREREKYVRQKKKKKRLRKKNQNTPWLEPGMFNLKASDEPWPDNSISIHIASWR